MPGIDPPSEQNWTPVECILAASKFMTDIAPEAKEQELLDLERAIGKGKEMYCDMVRARSLEKEPGTNMYKNDTEHYLRISNLLRPNSNAIYVSKRGVLTDNARNYVPRDDNQTSN